MNEIKKRNERKEFVTKFAIQNGYPVWNKVLMGTSQKQYAHASLAGNSLDGVTDTTILIPFVMEGEFSVKGFIRATLNDSVSLSYSLAKDYKAYEEKLDNSKTASSAFAMLSMALNKIVFNEEYYKITNPKILSTDTAHIATQKIKLNEINFSITDSANMRYLILCSSFTQTQAVCGTPGAAVCSDEDGCDAGSCPTNSCHLVTTTTNICTGIDYPDILGSTGGGSTGEGSGSNGGGPIPYVYPCETTQNNPAPFTATNNIEDPGDCPEPTEGDGWIPWQDEPSSFDPNNPCNVVDSLLKTTAFPVLLHKLRDSTINNYEIGYSQLNTLNPANYSETYYTGQFNSETLSVDVILNYATDGLAHNHYNSPDRLHNFSAEDIYKLAYYWSIGKINNLSTFSYTVVTDSTSYILMIDDPAAFITFAQTWFDTEEHIKAFAIHLYRNFHYANDGNSIDEDERAFLNALQAPPLNGAGLKLFRGNAGMNSFTPIKVSSTGQLVTNPCN